MQEPTPPRRSLQAIPHLLRDLDRWITWRYAPNPAGKITKRPDCSTRDPSKWRNLDSLQPDAGVGFVLTGGVDVAVPQMGSGPPRYGRLFGLDLDGCRDPETGELSAWALGIVQQFGNTYTEITPSGAGLRPWIIVLDYPTTFTRAKVRVPYPAPPGVTKTPELQVFGYGVPQYVTVTGERLVGTSDEILVVDNLDWLIETFELESGDCLPAAGKFEVGTTPAPTLDTMEARLRASPLAAAIFDAVWQPAVADRTTGDRSASAAFFQVAQSVIRVAGGHVREAVDFIQERTAWGSGDVEESADPAKYGRTSWLAAELSRAAEKGGSDHAAAFDDDFDALAWEPPPDAPPVPGSMEAVSRSPISTIRSPRPLFDAAPPPREYLLRHPNGDGFVPRGKVGLLNAAGGTGKTTAIVQLAVSLATGRDWLSHYKTPAKPQRVLLLLGEEDEEEVRRKLYWTCKAMAMTQAEQAAVEELVEAIPLAGHALPLLRMGENSNLEGTEHSDAIVERLLDLDDWGLVVIDPVSRFTAVNTESDNIIATRYAQELERFAACPGRPTVLAIGHTSKQARKDGVADFRGVTGLFDAVRWALTLQTKSKIRVELKIEKNNLAPPAEGIALVRGEHGLLSAETPEEARSVEARELAEKAAVEDAKEAREAEARERKVAKVFDDVIERVRAVPGLSKTELTATVKGSRDSIVKAAIDRALAEGLIRVEAVGRRSLYFVADILK